MFDTCLCHGSVEGYHVAHETRHTNGYNRPTMRTTEMPVTGKGSGHLDGWLSHGRLVASQATDRSEQERVGCWFIFFLERLT